MKHLCKLEQVMAQMELRETDADEGLQYTMSDAVVGGTMSNLFALIDGIVAFRRLEENEVVGPGTTITQVVDRFSTTQSN